jgi:drug/metabolite transporter (DMT)-like permease
MLGSCAVVAGMEAAVRGLSQNLHPFVIVFWREVFSTLLLVPLWAAAGRPLVRRSRLPLHGIRALLNGFAITLWYLALRDTPLAEATAITFTAILFSAIGSGSVLGERIKPLQWIAILAGIGGAMLIVGPRFEFTTGTERYGALIALASAVLFGASMLVGKLQTRGDGSIVSALLLAIGMGILAGLLALPFWAWPTLADLRWLALFGLCNVLGQVFFLEALRSADASIIIPLDVTRLVWALLFGALVYAEWPPFAGLLGAAIIAASAILVVLAAPQRALELSPVEDGPVG